MTLSPHHLHIFLIFTIVINEISYQDAAEFLSPQLGTKELLRLYAYWAKLERSLGKDLSAARGVWENAIKKRFYSAHSSNVLLPVGCHPLYQLLFFQWLCF